MSDPQTELAALRSKVATLEQLLEVHEATAREQTERLEEANATMARQARILDDKTRSVEQTNTELVERLRLALEELSTPILEVWDDVLALPIIGVVDSRRATQIMERLLEEIVRRQARTVIIDLTGVEVVDTKTADYFLKVVKAVELLGARCAISGIRPQVAQTLVELGVDLGEIRTSRNLKHALRDSLRPRSEGQAPAAAPPTRRRREDGE